MIMTYLTGFFFSSFFFASIDIQCQYLRTVRARYFSSFNVNQTLLTF